MGGLVDSYSMSDEVTLYPSRRRCGTHMGKESKKAIRERVMGARDSIDLEVREDAEELICQSVSRLIQWQNAKCVAVYAAIRSEVCVRKLALIAHASEKRVCYPRCRDQQTLDFVQCWPDSRWNPGAFGIFEPEGPGIPIESIDVVVVPLIAFDRFGARVGYGAGYYDRALDGFSGLKVATAFAAQEVSEIPQDSFDVRMDLIVTEERVISTMPFPDRFKESDGHHPAI